jgi:hypothetical protein
MNTTKKLAALFGAVVLLFAVFGIAAASAPGATEQGITPVLHDDANIHVPGDTSGGNEKNQDFADCAAADAVIISDASGSATSTNGVTVNLTTGVGETGEQDNEVDFTVDNGVVTIAYIKGGNGYNTYDYTGLGGVAWDKDLCSPVNGSKNPAGLSHAVFCTGPTPPSQAPSFEQSQAGTTEVPSEAASQGASQAASEAPSFQQSQGDITQCPCDTTPGLANTSHPADGAWLLVVALGVLLASVVVLTPARAKSRR